MGEIVGIKEGNNLEIPKFNYMEKQFQKAFNIVDDVVLKNYITKLTEMEIIPLDEETINRNIQENVRLFKINEMVYQKDEYSTYKFASVFNAVASSQSAIFIIIDSDGEKTDFYMGIRSMNPENSTKTSYDTLQNAIRGQFPGIKTSNLLEDEMNHLFKNIKGNSIASVSSVANSKYKDQNDNKFFIQGLEKLALSMQGEKYTGVIIANTTDQDELLNVRKGYEDIYTMMSPFANLQVSYGSNSSVNLSRAYTEGRSEGENHSSNISDASSRGSSKSIGSNKSISKETGGSIAGKTVGKSLAVAGAAIGSVIPGAGTLVGGAIGGAVGSLVGGVVSGFTHRAVSDTVSDTDTSTENTTSTVGQTHGTNQSRNEGRTDTQGLTSGSNENLQLNVQSKSIINCLERIDQQFERLNEFESLGMWECAAYFMSENSYASEIAASTYKALMRGKDSGIEVSAINLWNRDEKEKTKMLKEYITNFIHPVFKYNNNGVEIPVTPTTLVSGNELAIHMGLPRKSICGFPVIEHADFGKEIVSYNKESKNSINLGKIFNMGAESSTRALLDVESLSMHTFITGSTGSGKSNTVYEILDQLNTIGIKYLIIEPAKGEYKNIFGHEKGVTVLGTNPEKAQLLGINPFKFPEGIHVLEHVDRLIEIFNVCWPMYAAMPAVLKEAVIQAYEVSGWDLMTSKNIYSEDLFPTFQDLLVELENVIESSAYSQELKSNYTGALVTRVRSITNGLNGRIFSADETDNQVLFDSNVIVDLSRVGSMETKSLIMGILIMRLSEHRMCFTEGMNSPLKHVTVLEEAHNILKRTSSDQNPENPNLAGKSVEMISNAIAEMRTYGEGFIIADQSPQAVDISAIRNTNTKIIMRLPDESDRRLAGKSAGLKDEQLDEIAKLPKGVGVVYQNDWLEPVLCKVNKFNGSEEPYIYDYDGEEQTVDNKKFNSMILKLLLKNRVDEEIEIDIDSLKNLLTVVAITTKNKIAIHRMLLEYEENNNLKIWKEDGFEILSQIVSDFVGGKSFVNRAIELSNDYDDLTIRLNKSLDDITFGLSESMKLSINQCLLKDVSVDDSDKFEIYSAWITDLRGPML